MSNADLILKLVEMLIDSEKRNSAGSTNTSEGGKND